MRRPARTAASLGGWRARIALLALCVLPCGGYMQPPAHGHARSIPQLRRLPEACAVMSGSSSSSSKAVQQREAGEDAAPKQPAPVVGTTADGLANSLRSMMAKENLSPAALKMRSEQLEASYEKCRLITQEYAKTFYFGTTFFSEEKRRAVWAVYAWCRRTDDIVDKPRKETKSLREELAQWQERLTRIWQGHAHDQIDLALVDTVQRYPALTITPFEDMIKVRVRVGFGCGPVGMRPRWS